MTERPGSIVPARRAAAITPSDTVTIEQTRALHINTDGNIKVDFANGGLAIILTVVAGHIYPYEVVRVYDTDTDADSVALY